MKKIKNIVLIPLIYVIILISYKPISYAESTQQKLKTQNIITVMKICDISYSKEKDCDVITFEDNKGWLWSSYGDLKEEYKNQYALVVLQQATGQNFNSIKVIDFILKDEIKYITSKRIKDILNI